MKMPAPCSLEKRNSSRRWSFFLLCIILGHFIPCVNGGKRLRKKKGNKEELIEDRIIGGTPVTRWNRYPYIVPILDSENRPLLGSRIRQYCVGTLVAPDVVLSAAHCQGREGKSPDFVQFNALNLITPFVKNTRLVDTIKIVKQVPHPNFDPFTLDNDLVLFKLSEKNEEVSPVQLNRRFSLEDGDEVKVVGWGATAEAGNASPILRHVLLDYIPNEVCNSNQYGYFGQVLDSMICAASEDKDACTGDSGGPLLMPDPGGKNPAFDVQVGLVSWGVGCAQSLYPGVYAKIDFDWIMSAICDEETGLSPESCLDGEVFCPKR